MELKRSWPHASVGVIRLRVLRMPADIEICHSQVDSVGNKICGETQSYTYLE